MAGAAAGTAGSRLSFPGFSTAFLLQMERQDDRASFLLSTMNYLDFQGIFLIHKRLFLSTERKRPREGEAGFPELSGGDASVGHGL